MTWDSTIVDIGRVIRDIAGPDPLPPAPAFPDAVLPPAIDAYVQAAARSIGVPIEMVAMPIVVFAGSTIGNRLQVSLKGGFTQLPTLFVGLIADPGSAKSPAQRAAQWPVDKLQDDAHRLWQDQRAAYDAELEAWGAKPRKERGPKPQPPKLEHLYTTDPTIEALVEMLNQCQGVAIIRDELIGWITGMDQYRGGKGSDRQQYLSLWAGAPIKADRKGGGSTYTASPVVGIFGGIQPDKVRGIHDPRGDRDGMIERMLLYWPDVEPADWSYDELDPLLLDPVVDIFRALRSVGQTGSDDRLSAKFSPTAMRIWEEWFNANAAATREAQGLRRGFYSKMPNQVARIALILHALWNPYDPSVLIDDARLSHAIDVAEFFRSHLDRVLPLIGDHSRGEPVGLNGRVMRILRNPKKQGEAGWVRRSELLKGLGNVPTSVLTEALTQLFEQGLVETRDVKTGTKPAEEWRALEVTPSKYSGYSEIPPTIPERQEERFSEQVRTDSESFEESPPPAPNNPNSPNSTNGSQEHNESSTPPIRPSDIWDELWKA